MSADPSPYEGTHSVASLLHADGLVTLVEGQTFQLSDRSGNMDPDHAHGLIVLDTRVVSRWELLLNGKPLEALAVETTHPFAARFVGRAQPDAGRADADLVVFRHRHLGGGMREQISIVNHGLDDATIVVELRCEADFADLFEVKERRVRRQLGRHIHELAGNSLIFGQSGVRGDKQVTITVDEDAELSPGHATWRTTLPAGVTLDLWCEISVRLGDVDIEPMFTRGTDDEEATPRRRLERWHARLPEITTDHHGFAATVARSAEDLGALRIFDPEHPDLPILAAGAPWYMTVFGRDSLLTAWMTLISDPSLAHGVLETLARLQGTDENTTTEEAPGKILHEMRFGSADGLALGGGDRYYGSVDATPLFVMLLGEVLRWDGPLDLVHRLLPHADRALEWIEQYGDSNGDGYVDYHCQSDSGLANQGWKDSWDAIRHADGTLVDAPIALCEVQGYVYAAYTARALIARQFEDSATFDRCMARANDLRRRFNEDFWLDHRGTFALGLDRDGRPIDAVASNVGHCLWTGIIEPDRAPAVADRLLSDDHFSGFGVRTLDRSMAAYNPVSYHNGSVWPHDNAICAAGMERYGLVDHAHRIIIAQIDTAAALGHRLPELFAGFARRELGIPAPYPSSCSPQAWAAAAPSLWLRTLLRLDPWAPGGEVCLAPQLPDDIKRLRVAGIRIGDNHLTVEIDRDGVQVSGGEGLTIVTEPRSSVTELLARPDEIR